MGNHAAVDQPWNARKNVGLPKSAKIFIHSVYQIKLLLVVQISVSVCYFVLKDDAFTAPNLDGINFSFIILFYLELITL